MKIETNAPWTINRDCPLSLSVTFQRMKVYTSERWNIRQLSRGMKNIKAFDRQFTIDRTELPNVAPLIIFSSRRIFE